MYRGNKVIGGNSFPSTLVSLAGPCCKCLCRFICVSSTLEAPTSCLYCNYVKQTFSYNFGERVYTLKQSIVEQARPIYSNPKLQWHMISCYIGPLWLPNSSIWFSSHGLSQSIVWLSDTFQIMPHGGIFSPGWYYHPLGQLTMERFELRSRG